MQVSRPFVFAQLVNQETLAGEIPQTFLISSWKIGFAVKHNVRLKLISDTQ